MAPTDREVNLILKAQDLTTQPVSAVVAKVQELIGVLGGQVAASEKGATSAGNLSKALRDVEKVQGDLIKQANTLAGVKPVEDRMDAAKQRLENAKAIRDQYASMIQGTPTDAQAKQLNSLTDAVDKAQIAFGKADEKLQYTYARLAQMGVEAGKVSEAQERLNATILRTASALNAADGANTKFLENQERAKLVNAVLAAQTTGMRDTAKAAEESATATERAEELKQRAIAKTNAGLLGLVDQERDALARFQQEIDRGLARAQGSAAHVTTASRGVAGPVSAPAPTLATEVQNRLGTAPGAAAGLPNISAIQSEIAKINGIFAVGSVGTNEYTDALKRLDTVGRELARQSGIVDSFVKARDAATAAVKAVHDATVEMHGLHTEATNAAASGDKAKLSEVTSQIEAIERRMGAIGGSGLAEKAVQAKTALEIERDKLIAIGVAAGDVDVAMKRYTDNAVEAAHTRDLANIRERASLDAAAKAAEDNVAKLDASKAAGVSPTAVSASERIAGVGGPTRGGGMQVENIDASLADLEKTMAKGALTNKSFASYMDKIYATQRQIADDASLIDNFHRQTTAVSAAEAAYAKARVELLAVVSSAKAGTASFDQLKAAEDRFNVAGAATTRQAQAMRDLSAALVKRKIDTTDLTAATDKLVDQNIRLKAAQEGVDKSRGTVFGLSHYQLQDLSYQINDVITQLSLGQGVLRTFESQAGQIFQDFELSATSIGRLLVTFGLAAAAAFTVLAAIQRVNEAAAAVRETKALVTFNVDGSNYEVEALVKVREELRRYGVSWEDAGKAVKQFMTEGLNQDRFATLGKTAQNLVDANAVKDYSEALKVLNTVSTGSYDAIYKMLTGMNFLHSVNLDLIRDAFEHGDAEKGRILVLQALTQQAQEARDVGLSPLTIALRELKAGWDDFLNILGKAVPRDEVVSFITDIVHGMSSMIPLLAKAGEYGVMFLKPWIDGGKIVIKTIEAINDQLATGTTAALTKNMQTLKDMLAGLEADIRRLEKSGGGEDSLQGMRTHAEELKTKIAEVQADLDKLAKTPVTGGVQAGGATTMAALAATGGPVPGTGRGIPEDMKPLLAQSAATANLQQGLVEQLYRNEAGRNPDGSFRSSGAGAIGPLQTLAGTFDQMVREFRPLFEKLAQETGKSINVNDPGMNTLAGSLYYQQQLKRFGDPLLAAGAYNMGPGSLNPQPGDRHPGMQGVLNGIITIPEETRKYIEKFAAGIGLEYKYTGVDSLRSRVGTSTDGATLRQPGTNNRVGTTESEQIKKLGDEVARLHDPSLSGDQRKEQDQLRLQQFQEDLRSRIQSEHGGGPLSEALETAIQQRVYAQGKIWLDEANKQQAAKEDRLAGVIRGGMVANLKYEKSNPVAARQAVELEYETKFAALEKDVREGAGKAVVGGIERTAADARAMLQKEKERALVQASVAADEAAVADLVKARDEAIGIIRDQLAAGRISVTEAFKRLDEVTSKSVPRIKAAVAAALGDLKSLPQSPQTEAAIGKVERAEVTSGGDKAVQQIDAAALAKTTDLEKARNATVKEQDDLLRLNIITQFQRDEAVQKAYAKERPLIAANNAELLKQIEIQRANGTISEETYERLRATLQKSNAELTTYTGLTKVLYDGVPKIIETGAMTAVNSLTDAIGKGAAGTEKWSNVWRDMGSTVLKFIADALKGVANLILQFYVAAAVKSALNSVQSAGGITGLFGGAAGAAGGAASGAASGGSAAATVAADAAVVAVHGGGIIGSTTMRKNGVDMSAFVDAVRYHSGGVVAGLSSNEVPAILQHGEEVITRDDPRHSYNRGPTNPNADSPRSIKNVVVVGDEQVAGAMAGAHGERVIMSHIKRNGSSIRQLIGN